MSEDNIKNKIKEIDKQLVHLLDHDTIMKLQLKKTIYETFLEIYQESQNRNHIRSVDYLQKYETFWKQIVENEDGTLNKDQVMRELADYSMIMDNCTNAYDTMTDGMISIPNTKFYNVEEIFNEKYINKSAIVDDITCFLKTDDIDELKHQIQNYFGISESEV